MKREVQVGERVVHLFQNYGTGTVLRTTDAAHLKGTYVRVRWHDFERTHPIENLLPAEVRTDV